MDSNILLKKILLRFSERKIAQVQGYNKFEYISENGGSVFIGREKGKDTPVPYSKILIAIEAYQKNYDLHDLGPSALRFFGITHVTSPIYAMLHLLEKEEYH